MEYYSTNRQSLPVSLQDAVLRGLAPDRGLYMPQRIGTLPRAFSALLSTVETEDE